MPYNLNAWLPLVLFGVLDGCELPPGDVLLSAALFEGFRGGAILVPSLKVLRPRDY